MYCVYWKITGPPIPVLRGAWMYDQVINLLPTRSRAPPYLHPFNPPRTAL